VLPSTVNRHSKPSKSRHFSPLPTHDRKVTKPHHNAGWNAFPESLPREEVVIDLPDAEKQGLKLLR